METCYEPGVVTENLRIVEEKIQNACKRSGRKREDVTLIAVSKTKPVSMILEAYRAGIRDFGENKVQELMEKKAQLPSDIRWHMIGHLQRNKVKYLIGNAALIHSVDSLRLAEEISRESVKKGVETDVLIEVNAAGEESKFGVSPEEVLSLVTAVSELPAVHIKGLMTIAPYTENPEENRKYFSLLKHVSMSVLSMGMTNDYEVAVEEGATYVRVGTGIFGLRSLGSAVTDGPADSE